MSSDARHNDEVILAKLDGFRELFEERTSTIMNEISEIRVQTTKTNGRVTALEMTGAEAKGKAKVTGILWGGITSIVVSVVAFFINKQVGT